MTFYAHPRGQMPEVELKEQLSAFQKALSDDQQHLFRSQRDHFSPPTIDDVMTLVAEIDESAVRKERRSGRVFGPRLTNLLQAVQQFASAGDDVIGGSLSYFACNVWLTVCMALRMLAEYPHLLEKVSTLFMSAGRLAPRFQEVGSFYSQSEQLQSCLQGYFIIVVRVCQHFVKSTQRSSFVQVVSFLTESELKYYKSELERLAYSIKKEVESLKGQKSSEHLDDPAETVPDSHQPESQPTNLAYHFQLLKSYSTYDYIAAWRRIRRSGTTKLFISQPEYQNFIACHESSTLLQFGEAGAGKSVILANMVEHLSQRLDQNALVVYFFCRYDQPDSLQARMILGSLTRQILERVRDEIFYDEHSSTHTFTIDIIFDLLQSYLKLVGKTYIVLDGLNECQWEQRNEVISRLQELQTKFSLSICLSSRPGSLDLSGWAKPESIYVPTNNPDVPSYIDAELQQRLKSGQLVVGDPALSHEIRSALIRGANGNFVWVKMQIELLCKQPSDYSIRQVLSDFSERFSDAIDPQRSATTSPLPTATNAASPVADSAYASASYMDKSNKYAIDNLAVEGSLQGHDGEDVDDSVTEYSDVSSTTLSRKQLYIAELAADLYNKISSTSSAASQASQVDIPATLPSLLKAFALKIGYCATTQMHRDVMAFVHKHRREITTAFLHICLGKGEVEPGESREQAASMSLQERMDLWDQNENIERASLEEDLESLEILQQEEEDVYGDDEIWVAAYREFAPNTEAYSWLLTQLQREMDSSPAEPTAIRVIRDQILSSLPSPHRISRSISSQSCSVRFEVDWDILKFFVSQGYYNPPDQVLQGVITLTGSSCDAQATSCSEFMKQTWPVTGNLTLLLLRNVLKLGPGRSHLYQLPDGTTLTAWIQDSQFMVQADGPAASISETGEQLAWLGSALRSSPCRKGLAYCTPTIRVIHQDQERPQIGLTRPSMICEIGFEVEPFLQPQHIANGQCWHGIFKNPIVVKGYPILPKPEKNTGLEIPLNIMAGLARAQRVDRFNDKIYIKGFSTMLVPTKKSNDIMYWHLIYKEDGSRVSYLDDNLNRGDHPRSLGLTNCRHVLGWCSEAKFYAGSAQAQYNVRHSELPKPHAQCALAGTIVTLGRMVTGGPSFELGIKDTPVQVARNGYIPRLKWISSKFVLLWDESDKHGWLINGTSALLHLVRASLAYDSTDKFQAAFVFKAGDLQESPRPFTADSAIDVLINSKNLGLKLYPEKDGYIVLADRVDQYYSLLEKLLDHQTDITRRHGGNLMKIPRKYLEGWDFEDLAANRDPLHPRMATIETAGKGWVDLTRTLQAVTLTGRGFGQLLSPVGSALCEYWAKLPTQRYLLACCVSDMESIIRDHRTYSDNHARLSDDLIWHNAGNISGKCQCRCLSKAHGEPVQIIFPSALSHVLSPTRSLTHLDGNGAVVFGHNSGFSWIWGDTGPPLQGQLQDESTAPYPEDWKDKDSGVGASLVSSGSDDHTSSILSSGTSQPTPHLREWRGDTAISLPECKKHARSQYTVGILCALPIELKAIRALFDQRHQNLTRMPGDNNQYALGQMSQHMVVAAALPAGEYGTNAAASAISDMMRSFLCIQFCLLVGIAGGAPSEDNDIRLGDVVVSLPTSTFPGVIQYDLGKENEGSDFELTGVLQRPPRILTNAINKLRSDPDLGFNALNPYLTQITNSLPTYGNPGQELDVLFRDACTRRACKLGCSHLQERVPRLTTEPRIHYGLVASGNRVVKDATLRDTLARKYGVLCFEMEAAGVVNRANCLVIRGICDYSDARKTNIWQNYAAATAAAYTKHLLGAVAVVEDASGNSVRTDDEPVSKRRKIEIGNVG